MEQEQEEPPERIQSTPLPNASCVHRLDQDGSILWSATRLSLPGKTRRQQEDAKEEATPTRLEICHSLVLGQDNDPFFFNQDYSVAASTGLTKVWDGAWTVLRLLLQPEQDDKNHNMNLFARDCGLQSLSSQNNDSPDLPAIIEIGAGSGLVGLTAACLGAHVLMTDVPTVVENALEPNIQHNTKGKERSSTSSPWPDSKCIGRGSVACASFDWRRVMNNREMKHSHIDDDDDGYGNSTIPLTHPADVVLAVECLWLKELLQPFVQASLALLLNSNQQTSSSSASSSTTVMYMCSRERAKADSQIFCSPQMAVDAFREAGCIVTLILEEELQEQQESDTNELPKPGPVQLFRIEAPPSPS